MNLKEAVAKGKLKQFIKERTTQKGDAPKFDATLSSMASGKPPQKLKEAPVASPPDYSEN